MPRFFPLSGQGRNATTTRTGQMRFANDTEVAAGLADNLALSVKDAADLVAPDATTSVAGKVIINTDGTLAGADNTDVPTSLAAKTYMDALAISGAAVADETTPGIQEVATSAEACAVTLDTKTITPLKLGEVLAEPPALGSTTPAAATFTSLTSDGTAAVSLVSNAAALFDTTGAGIDLTLSSDAGRVVINGEEAAANAITLVSAAGGLDVDAALQVNIASSQNAADAIRISASAGGIDVDAVGSAGEDISIVNTGGSLVLSATESAVDAVKIEATAGGVDILASGAAAGEDIDIIATGSSVNITSTENVSTAVKVEATLGGIDILASGASAGEDIDIIATGSSVNVSSTEDAANAVHLHANGGTSETIKLHSDQGTGVSSLNLLSDVGGITLEATGLASADAINLVATAGGIDADAALQINIASSQNAASAVVIAASAGGIDITATGAAAEDLDLTCTNGSVNVVAGEADVAAMSMQAAAGGLDVDTALQMNLASSEAAVNAIRLSASAGGIDVNGALEINIDSSEAAVADAVRIVASAADGGIDCDSGTGGTTIDSTGAISIDAAAASNFSVSGAGIDLDLASSAGRIIATSGEDAADSIYLHANAGTSETIRLHSDLGTGAASVHLESDVGGVTLTSGLASADAINLSATAGGVDVDGVLQVNIASSQAATGALTLAVSNAAANITHTGACAYTPDSVTSDNAGVACSVNTVMTLITTDGDSNEDNVTLADGLVSGQVKHFAIVAVGNAADSIKITPANMFGGTKITFAADPSGLGASFVFDGTNWTCFANNGGTIA